MKIDWSKATLLGINRSDSGEDTSTARFATPAGEIKFPVNREQVTEISRYFEENRNVKLSLNVEGSR